VTDRAWCFDRKHRALADDADIRRHQRAQRRDGLSTERDAARPIVLGPLQIDIRIRTVQVHPIPSQIGKLGLAQTSFDGDAHRRSEPGRFRRVARCVESVLFGKCQNLSPKKPIRRPSGVNARSKSLI
jgi:hypothetical protein